MTWYLKYRPQTVDQLDSVVVRNSLKKTLSAGELPHAWLFSGPRGTGKTSAARILAKAINCQRLKKKTETGIGEPCNQCDMCESITAGTAVDVMEIDAASNRGIDDIRDLRDKARLAPMKAARKVFIIDEAHMLTTEAANALLKMLEEPPENTLFFLCTTEPDKLPVTVISRCTRIQFVLPSEEEVEDKLSRVAKAEKLVINQKDLVKITRAAKGSFRDAIKLLEQVGVEGDTDAVLGLAAGMDIDRFWELIRQNQTKEAIGWVEEEVRKGVNVRSLVEILVEKLRRELYQLVETKTDRDKISGLLGMIEGLDEVYLRIKTAVVTQLPLEIWIIENTGEASAPRAEIKKQPLREQKSENKSELSSENTPSDSPSLVKEGEGGVHKRNLVQLGDKWGEIMKKVKPKNHSVEALLRSTKPVSFDGETLVLEVFYKFHLDKLGSDKCRQIVEEAVSEVLEIPRAKLQLLLGKKVNANKEEVSAEGVGDDIIKAAAEIFGAEAV